MYYVVPNMKLVTQDKCMSCWYASGLMLIQWRRRTRRMSESKHPDPTQLKRWNKLYDLDAGINNAQIPPFAEDLGLRMVPPMSPTPQGLLNLLLVHGPLWVNGKFHITVIAGIRDTAGDLEVLVFDPAPSQAHKTNGEWRSMRAWYVSDPNSGRDSRAGVQTVFLYVP